ncbi:MAG: TauD/TfdA family dioxygenase [Pseudomonadota bacterium]
MTIHSVAPNAQTLSVHWTDGETTEYPYLFLRDNDPAGFHPQTHERLFDLLDAPEDLTAASAHLDGDAVAIAWGPGGESRIPTDWLFSHRPGQRLTDPADVPTELWDGGYAARMVTASAEALLSDDVALLTWLMETKRTGLSIVTGIADDEDAALAIGARIGFLRETNFGRTFRVETMPDPNNLAYTSEALPLHTDLPNQELPPGFQFLHCVRNGAEGGGSVFMDAFHVAEEVRKADAEAFDLLSSIPVPYRFTDRDTDIRIHRPVINLDERERVHDVRYNAHLLAALDMPADTMVAYYRAFRRFMAETRKAEHTVTLKLQAGEMAVFDNRRILHGRTAFDPQSGHRLLRGFYIDRGEWDSRIRTL